MEDLFLGAGLAGAGLGGVIDLMIVVRAGVGVTGAGLGVTDAGAGVGVGAGGVAAGTGLGLVVLGCEGVGLV